MDFQNNEPIYIQIGTAIKEQIVNGSLKPGEKLPSVREYAIIFEVSPLTIHRAVQYLETEGVIETKKGIGSFVRSEIQEKLSRDMIEQKVHDFIGRLRKCGLSDEAIEAAVMRELKGVDRL